MNGLLRRLLELVAPLLPAKFRPAVTALEAAPLPTPRGTVTVPPDPAEDNLHKIDHIVVLMLENRSFDHMLGYLSLTGGRTDIDGLKPGMSNEYGGRDYPIEHLDRTALDGEAEDPCHSPDCVDEQISGGMGGFVSSFAKHLAGARPPAANPDPGLVMRYYDERELPVYDFLAREFCVCDSWFSSVAGATWPNRLYSIAGRAAGSREDLKVPIYNLPAFTRHLDDRGIDWHWYSYDPGTLRMVDAQYRLTNHHHFAYFDSRKLSISQRAVGELFEEGPSFLDDAANGALPAVSWIDPHWKDARVLAPDSNDDHPPSDIVAGQDLVLTLYNALRNSPAWERTMLVITYDEHGGFFDHVTPPDAPDDDPAFTKYGVRVPAVVVSPLVERGAVSHETFDHTSILATILRRFCRNGDQLPDMGARTTNALHLGSLLTREAPREDIRAHVELARGMVAWRNEFATARFASALDVADPRPLTSLQSEHLAAFRALRAKGLPAGHP